MGTSRSTVVLQLLCLALLLWLVLRTPGPVEASNEHWPAGQENLTAELQRINDRLDRLSIAQQSNAQQDRTEVDRNGRPISNDVASELRALRWALQKLEEAVANIPKPYAFHPEEIKKHYPTTNWQACKALLDKVSAETKQKLVRDYAGVTDKDYLHTMSRAIFGSKMDKELELLRPQQVLDRFGAPTKVVVGEGGFEWKYHPPESEDDAHLKDGLEITFAHGYVSSVYTYRH